MTEHPKIELFDNPNPERDYTITIRCPDLTSVCPKTRPPHFGEFTVEHCTDTSCLIL